MAAAGAIAIAGLERAWRRAHFEDYAMHEASWILLCVLTEPPPAIAARPLIAPAIERLLWDWCRAPDALRIDALEGADRVLVHALALVFVPRDADEEAYRDEILEDTAPALHDAPHRVD